MLFKNCSQNAISNSLFNYMYFNSVINHILESQNSQTYSKDVSCANVSKNTTVSPGNHTLFIKT